MLNCNNWFYLCLALCGVILSMLAMFFGYNLKLGVRTAQLEKKNGREQKQIDQLKKEVARLKEKKWLEPELPEIEDETIYCPEPTCPECEQEECICDGRDIEEGSEEPEEVDHD